MISNDDRYLLIEALLSYQRETKRFANSYLGDELAEFDKRVEALLTTLGRLEVKP